MPVVHRTHVRISRIAAPLARRVGDHDFGLGANVRIALAEHDGVAIALRHLAAVEAGDARRPRQHHFGLGQYFSYINNRTEIRNLVSNILDACLNDSAGQLRLYKSSVFMSSFRSPPKGKLRGKPAENLIVLRIKKRIPQGEAVERIESSHNFAA